MARPAIGCSTAPDHRIARARPGPRLGPSTPRPDPPPPPAAQRRPPARRTSAGRAARPGRQPAAQPARRGKEVRAVHLRHRRRRSPTRPATRSGCCRSTAPTWSPNGWPSPASTPPAPSSIPGLGRRPARRGPAQPPGHHPDHPWPAQLRRRAHRRPRPDGTCCARTTRASWPSGPGAGRPSTCSREFPVRADAQEWADVLKRLQPRLYSISSSPLVEPAPGRAHRLGRPLRQPARSRRAGVCSTFLADAPPSAPVPVFVQRSPALPPAGRSRPPR